MSHFVDFVVLSNPSNLPVPCRVLADRSGTASPVQQVASAFARKSRGYERHATTQSRIAPWGIHSATIMRKGGAVLGEITFCLRTERS